MIQEDIIKAMRKLQNKAIKNGVYENFGDREIRTLREKHGDCGLIRDFENWCSEMDDNRIRQVLQ
jgi:hypothetical protein